MLLLKTGFSEHWIGMTSMEGQMAPLRVMVLQSALQEEGDAETISSLVRIVGEKEGLPVEEYSVPFSQEFPEEYASYDFFVARMLGRYCVITPKEARIFFEKGYLE